jgi:hypothetical protein
MWSDDGKIDAQVIEAIRIFEKAMLCPERLSKRDLQCIIRYAFEVGHVMPLSNTTASTPYREWLSKVLSSMLDPKDIDYDKYLGWGWKEPCTYIYLRQLKQCFQSMKYIHVIRHGLDMAFSANETHLQNWSRFFGFQCPKEKELIPDAQLKFWNAANAYAAKTAKQILGTDFLLVRFEDICLETETALRQIFEFLGLELTNNVLDKFIKMVEVPPSLNRYKTKDISSLDPAQVSKIQEFGYRV